MKFSYKERKIAIQNTVKEVFKTYLEKFNIIITYTGKVFGNGIETTFKISDSKNIEKNPDNNTRTSIFSSKLKDIFRNQADQIKESEDVIDFLSLSICVGLKLKDLEITITLTFEKK